MLRLMSIILIAAQAIRSTHVYRDGKGCLCESTIDNFTICINEKGKRCKHFPLGVDAETLALEIRATDIYKIKQSDFKNLMKLKNLTFLQNQFLRSIRPGALQSLISLEQIELKYNAKLEVLSPSLFHGLKNLKAVTITGNKFTKIDDITNALQDVQLDTLNLSEEKFSKLTNDTFKSMQNTTLRSLTLERCEVESLDSGTFKPLKHLKNLRIGDNRLTHDDLINALNETIESGVDLQLLDISSSSFRGEIPPQLQDIIAKSNISQLILAGNHFDSINLLFISTPWPKLKVLNLTDVQLRNMDYGLLMTPNLEELIIEKNILTSVPCGLHLSSLKYLNIRHNTRKFTLDKGKFYHLPALEVLDLSFTRLSRLLSDSFGNISSLRNLSLANCSLSSIQKGTFSGLTNLRYLNIENNGLWKVSPEIKPIASGYSNDNELSKVETLKFGGNDLEDLEFAWKEILTHMKHIKHLYLENNKIRNISSIRNLPLKSLETLDVSNNYIEKWNEKIFTNTTLKEFIGKDNKISFLSDAMIDDFRNLTSIFLFPNPFLCNCKVLRNLDNMTKILHLIQDRDKLTCIEPTGISFNNFTQNAHEYSLELDCESTVYVFDLILIAIIVCIFLIFGTLLYLFRWRIKYQMFLIKFRLMRRTTSKLILKGNEKHYDYDVFVSYCSKDQNFVTTLVNHLENSQPPLKVCVFERDFQIGTVISESVLENIAKSRKTLLIISNAYARSYWCTWESHIARHYKLFSENSNRETMKNSIILIKLEVIKEENLTPTLKYLLGTRNYLQWNEEEAKQKVFWMQLIELLRVVNRKDMLKNDSLC